MLRFKAIINSIDALRAYRAFLHDVTAAILVFQNNKTAAFLCKRFLLFQYICIDAGHVSENALFRETFFSFSHESLQATTIPFTRLARISILQTDISLSQDILRHFPFCYMKFLYLLKFLLEKCS